MTALAAVQPDPLGELAVRVREEHEAVQASACSMLQHAIAAGESLIEAKAMIEYGEWLPWLQQNFPASEDTAEVYMRLARNSERVRNLPGDTSIREALRALSASTKPRVPKPEVWAHRHPVGGQLPAPDPIRQADRYIEALMDDPDWRRRRAMARLWEYILDFEGLRRLSGEDLTELRDIRDMLNEMLAEAEDHATCRVGPR